MALADFYKTKAWEQLRRVVIEQRVNPADGFIYCAYCGKPIVRAYDCIAHHMTELTETNYNDATIALNPDNIELVHHKCHNKIHDKYGMRTRKVYIVYGAPLSGKTSYVEDVKNDGDLIIDMDNIWQCVSGCDRYIKPKRLNAVVFGIRDELLNMVKYRVGNWRCAYVIGGYPLATERNRLAGDIGAETILIESTKDECLTRLNQQNERDIDEWTKYIDKWFDIYAPPIDV